ncbi:hypothetical protein BDV96DRAFT_594059 [Lophiotrema nucula]|uniref:Uncharacterized protein n=1 Tax=Lophiotrema nucula TaxID=690887 RepID=A0A6A5ZTE1_9PLEO|nr:hypothetical protein BDV96DRAFT_594059 [Lophiotrema nucula]
MKKALTNVFSRKRDKQVKSGLVEPTPYASRNHAIKKPEDPDNELTEEEAAALAAFPADARPYLTRFNPRSKLEVVSVNCGEKKKLRKISIEKIKPQCKILYALLNKPVEERRIALPDVTIEDLDKYIKYSNMMYAGDDAFPQDKYVPETMAHQLNWEDVACVAIITEKMQDDVLQKFIEDAISRKGKRVKYLPSKLFGGDVVDEVYTRTTAGSWVRKAFAEVASHSKTFTRNFDDADEFVEDVSKIMQKKGSAGVYDEDSDSDGYDVCRATEDIPPKEMVKYDDEFERLPLYESDSDEVVSVKTPKPEAKVHTPEKLTPETSELKAQQSFSKEAPSSARQTAVPHYPRPRLQESSTQIDKQSTVPSGPSTPHASQPLSQPTSAISVSVGKAAPGIPAASSIARQTSTRVPVTPQQQDPTLARTTQSLSAKAIKRPLARESQAPSTLHRKPSIYGSWRDRPSNPSQQQTHTPSLRHQPSFNGHYKDAKSEQMTWTPSGGRRTSISLEPQYSSHHRKPSVSEQQTRPASFIPRPGSVAESRPPTSLGHSSVSQRYPPSSYRQISTITQEAPPSSLRRHASISVAQTPTFRPQPTASQRPQSPSVGPFTPFAPESPLLSSAQQAQTLRHQPSTSQGYTPPHLRRQASVSQTNPPSSLRRQASTASMREPVNPSYANSGLRAQFLQSGTHVHRDEPTDNASFQQTVRRTDSQILREQPVRQPRNPVDAEELKRAPTLRHKGSRNFLTRQGSVQALRRAEF